MVETEFKPTILDIFIIFVIEIASMGLIVAVSLVGMLLVGIVLVATGQITPTDVHAPVYIMKAAGGYYAMWTTLKVETWLITIFNLSVYTLLMTIPTEKEASDIIGGKRAWLRIHTLS